MSINLMKRYFAFDHWANTHVATLLAQLPREVIEADSARFYSGSAWTLLRHMVDVEWSWLRCCQLLDMKDWVWDIYPMETLDEMLAFLAEEYPRVIAYVETLTDADLEEMIPFPSDKEGNERQRTRGDVMLHLLNHGTEHRGDLAHFLTDHNLSPGDLDYLDWLTRTMA